MTVLLGEEIITLNIRVEGQIQKFIPYLSDLINDHKPTTELTNRASNNDSERGEWKMQLLMQNNCISTKDFDQTRTIYSASKPVEIFVGNDTNDTIDRLFYTLL